MWSKENPIRTDWSGGSIQPEEILYEIDSPTIFTAELGLVNYIFFKRDELEETEIFLVCPIENEIVKLLISGNLSVWGAMADRHGWLIETDCDYQVVRFQECDPYQYQSLLPPKGIGIRASFGDVPDTLEQANSFLSFRFVGRRMSTESIPLSVLKEFVEKIAIFVQGALLPAPLTEGRNSRFFDIQVGQPKLASLLLTLKKPEVDDEGLKNFAPTQNLQAGKLVEESLTRGKNFWNEFSEATTIAKRSNLSKSVAEQYKDFLANLVSLLPTEENDLDGLEVGFKTGERTKIIKIDKRVGDRLAKAHELNKYVHKALRGVVTEVNGESKTFILKSGERSITCVPASWIFEKLDKEGSINRGVVLRVNGSFEKRKNRDRIYVNQYQDIIHEESD